jgi:hypothetical protein
MKQLFSIGCFGFIIAIYGQTLFAKNLPTSAEQLRAEVESALKAKDTNAFTTLFNWQGVSDDMKSEMKDESADVFSHDIDAVKLTALPADFQPTNEMNGVRYRPNVVTVGNIEVAYVQKGNSVSLPYGTAGGVYYLSGTVEEKIAIPATKEKSLNISVMGSAMPEAGGFTGSYVYVKGGNESVGDLNGKGNRSVFFWGDYVKSCTVQKTADNQDWIKLVISEDGKKIFESEKITNKEPFVYEKK